MVKIIAKNKKVSREERIICTILTIAIFAISIAGCVLGKLFTSDEALADNNESDRWFNCIYNFLL